MNVYKTVKYGNSSIRYKVTRSNKRSKTSHIIVEKNNVNVIVPENKTDQDIKKLIKTNSRWIFTKKLEQKSLSLKNEKTLLYRGKHYKFQVHKGNKNSISFKNGKFIVIMNNFSQYNLNKLYQNWITQRARLLIPKRVNVLSNKISFKAEKINIKNLKNRWGSISDDGSLNINLNLVKAPQNVLDYIIIHELCHKKIPNHSHKFWNLLSQIVPNYEYQKRWLDLNGKMIYT